MCIVSEYSKQNAAAVGVNDTGAWLGVIVCIVCIPCTRTDSTQARRGKDVLKTIAILKGPFITPYYTSVIQGNIYQGNCVCSIYQNG